MPITLLDIILLAVMFLSAMLAMVRGFMREILSIAAWAAAALATLYLYSRLLPVAKDLVVKSLRQLAIEHGFQNSSRFESRIRQAIARVNAVKRVRPDMDSRDNASVFLSRPHVITVGTLFLAG